MPSGSLRQAAKLSSLDAAKSFYFIIAALAVRQALLFLNGTETIIPKGFSFLVRLFVALGFIFTVFRFSHGVALVYDLEKKTAETSTTPWFKRVELTFVCLVLEVAALFLMSTALGRPKRFIVFTVALAIFDLGYINVSRILKDAKFRRVFYPPYLVKRWNSTIRGTAPRAYVQWAFSDLALSVLFFATTYPRPTWLRWTTGTPDTDWALTLSFLLILAGVVDYWMNGEFYFGKRHRGRRLVFVASPLKPVAAQNRTDALTEMHENVRRAQWYCREIYCSGNEIPFASHGFYTYFLDDAVALDRKVGTKCASEYLAHCDALYLYTVSGALCAHGG